MREPAPERPSSFMSATGMRRRLAHVETDRAVKGGQPRRLGGNEPKPNDRLKNQVR